MRRSSDHSGYSLPQPIFTDCLNFVDYSKLSMINTLDFSHIRFVPATVSFLEMHAAPANSILIKPETTFTRLEKPVSVAEYREYYYGVGKEWHWLDRMVMPDQELFEKINAANTEIWVMKINDVPAGFAEFVCENDFTEIQYFGLLPDFVGKGYGSYFLAWVIEKAWSYHPTWIQLNTCTLDHPNALAVYQKAGFVKVRTEVQQRSVYEFKGSRV